MLTIHLSAYYQADLTYTSYIDVTHLCNINWQTISQVKLEMCCLDPALAGVKQRAFTDPSDRMLTSQANVNPHVLVQSADGKTTAAH